MRRDQRSNRTNPTTRQSRRRIPDGTPCGYCFDEWATVWDHLQPYSKNGLTVPENLYPACKRCNLLLSDFSFPTIQEKREYVRTTLIERGEWHPIMEGAAFMPDVSKALYEDAEDTAVLLTDLSQEGLEGGPEEHVHLPDLPKPIRKKKTTAKILQPKVSLASMAPSKDRKHDLKRTCRTCRKSFVPVRKNQIYCDAFCKTDTAKTLARFEKRIVKIIDERIKAALERFQRGGF